MYSYVSPFQPQEVEVATVDNFATTAINLAGNALANLLIGNAGANALTGDGGRAVRRASLLSTVAGTTTP